MSNLTLTFDEARAFWLSLNSRQKAEILRSRALGRYPPAHPIALPQTDAPCCPNCGNLMYRSGTCYLCQECGSTTGCS